MALSENAELEELIRRATDETTGQLPPITGMAQAADQEEPGGGLDLSTLTLVARRSLIWVLLLLLLGGTASWLFLRYTKPIYKSMSLLKLDERSEADNFKAGALKASDPSQSSTQLAGEVELIKSNLTYQHLKERLALDVNYYAQGTVLETELYNIAPFRVRYKVQNPQFYGRKFQVAFPTSNRYEITVKAGEQTLTGAAALGQWTKLPGVEVLLESAPGRMVPATNDPPYSFVILNDGAIDAYLNRNLDVTVVNANANTSTLR